MGDGRNDSVMRIYSTGEGETLLEFTWTGTVWDEDTVGQAGAIGVAVGPGRNDGITRVYASSGDYDNYIYEHTWQGGAWIEVAIQGGSLSFGKPALGNGRNDDTIRVYAANGDGHVYEFSWNGSTWDVTDVAAVTGRVNDLTIGTGRNDGINRIYGGDNGGRLHEYTWDGSNWVETANLFPSASTYMREVHVGNGRNDGVIRVYCASVGSGLTEFSWSGTDWLEENVSTEIDGLTIGAGRNDGIMRVYAASFSAFSEYTYSVGIGESRCQNPNVLFLEISPNPFRNNTGIRWQLKNDGKVSLAIYDATGRLIKDFSRSTPDVLRPTVLSWDGTDDSNRKLPSGVYFLKLVTGDYSATEKLLLIR